MTPDPRRSVPRTDRVLADPQVAAAVERVGRPAVRAAVARAQGRVRSGRLAAEHVVAATLAALPPGPTSLRPAINATGVVVHTNLGRAPLSDAARAALLTAAGTVDVEFDLETGTRARRGRGTLAALRAAVPAAEDVLVVNNGAAALLLAVTALAARHEVIVSRGELVEIGDGFRLPDLMTSAGARLREVGTTNRTTYADYRGAVGDASRCVVKVHPSNFRISGFTASVPVAQLAELGLPVVADIGSGLLHPDPLLPDEPDVTTALQDGAALVVCSGDKLLGGPQAGLVFGVSAVVERLRRHPMARALRVDKLTLAALEATVAVGGTPVAAALHADPAVLESRATSLAAALAALGVDAQAVASDGVAGGGGAPGVLLPGAAVSLPEVLAGPLRHGEPAVVGRVAGGRCLLDLRCVPAADDARVQAAVVAAAAALR